MNRIKLIAYFSVAFLVNIVLTANKFEVGFITPRKCPGLGYALIGAVLRTYIVEMELFCALDCKNDDNCLSYNYEITNKNRTGTCEHNSATAGLDGMRLWPKTGFAYYEKVGFDNMKSTSCTQWTGTIGCGSTETAFIAPAAGAGLTANAYCCDSNHAPVNARLDWTGGIGAWAAQSNDVNQWIQMDIGEEVVIHAVAIQGRYNGGQRVTSYRLAYSFDGVTFTDYNNQEVLAGSVDDNTAARQDLSMPFIARYVRLHPVTWSGHISMRWELYGC